MELNVQTTLESPRVPQVGLQPADIAIASFGKSLLEVFDPALRGDLTYGNILLKSAALIRTVIVESGFTLPGDPGPACPFCYAVAVEMAGAGLKRSGAIDEAMCRPLCVRLLALATKLQLRAACGHAWYIDTAVMD